MEKKNKENYTLSERTTFLTVMEEFRSVIDDKRINAPARERKEVAWSFLVQKYNSSPGVSCPRTKKQLKILWKNMKAHAKRNCYEMRLPNSATKAHSINNQELIKVELSNQDSLDLICEDMEKNDSWDDDDDDDEFNETENQSDASKDLSRTSELTITEIHSEADQTLVPKVNNYYGIAREIHKEIQNTNTIFYADNKGTPSEANKIHSNIANEFYPIDDEKDNLLLSSKYSQTDGNYQNLELEEHLAKMELYKLKLQSEKLNNEHIQEQINSTKAHMQQVKIEHEMRLVELTLRMDLARAELDVWKIRKQNLSKDKQF